MQVLRLSFTLPERERMAELGKLMTAAMHFIDAVGSYKLRPEQRLRAEKLRKDVAAMEWRKQDEQRRESAEERRAAKRKEELVRAAQVVCACFEGGGCAPSNMSHCVFAGEAQEDDACGAREAGSAHVEGG